MKFGIISKGKTLSLDNIKQKFRKKPDNLDLDMQSHEPQFRTEACNSEVQTESPIDNSNVQFAANNQESAGKTQYSEGNYTKNSRKSASLRKRMGITSVGKVKLGDVLMDIPKLDFEKLFDEIVGNGTQAGRDASQEIAELKLECVEIIQKATELVDMAEAIKFIINEFANSQQKVPDLQIEVLTIINGYENVLAITMILCVAKLDPLATAFYLSTNKTTKSMLVTPVITSYSALQYYKGQSKILLIATQDVEKAINSTMEYLDMITVRHGDFYHIKEAPCPTCAQIVTSIGPGLMSSQQKDQKDGIVEYMGQPGEQHSEEVPFAADNAEHSRGKGKATEGDKWETKDYFMFSAAALLVLVVVYYFTTMVAFPLLKKLLWWAGLALGFNKAKAVPMWAQVVGKVQNVSDLEQWATVFSKVTAGMWLLKVFLFAKL